MGVTTSAHRLDVLDPADIGRLTDEVLPLQLTREVEPQVRELMASFAEVAFAEAGVTASFGVVDARVLSFLTDFSVKRVTGINAVTRRELRLALAEGVLAGEGVAALSRRVRTVFQRASVTRAKIIARTEVNAAANFVRNMAFEEAGVDVVRGRRWLATRDNRTRNSHRRLHNQIRPMGEPFQIPGTSKMAMYPGGFGTPAEDVNCRCVILPVLSRTPSADAEDGPTVPLDSDRKTLAVFDRMALRWELVLERAFRRAFLAQERLVLRRLEFIDDGTGVDPEEDNDVNNPGQQPV